MDVEQFYLPVMSFFLSVTVEGEQSHFSIIHLSNQCTHGRVLLCEKRNICLVSFVVRLFCFMLLYVAIMPYVSVC